MICTREAAAGLSRGQGGLICTREGVTGLCREQEGLICTREGREPARAVRRRGAAAGGRVHPRTRAGGGPDGCKSTCSGTTVTRQ